MSVGTGSIKRAANVKDAANAAEKEINAAKKETKREIRKETTGAAGSIKEAAGQKTEKKSGVKKTEVKTTKRKTDAKTAEVEAMQTAAAANESATHESAFHESMSHESGGYETYGVGQQLPVHLL